MIKAIALDDEPLALKVIEAFSKKTAGIELQRVFTDPAEALKYLRKYPVDLLFVDVQMPSMSGIDFYKSVEQSMMVIFTTAYSEYALEGFNLSAVDYLLKPIQFERFQQAVKKAEEYSHFLHSKENPEQQSLFLRIDYSLVKVAIHDILYIEGLDNYLKIHLRNNKPLVVRMSMKGIMEKLPEHRFMRVHRSYIVSLADITSIRNKIIYIGEVAIPVGTNYEQAVDGLIDRR